MERRTTYGVGVAGVGVLLAIIQLVQGTQQVAGFDGSAQVIVFALETIPFVIIGISLIAIGYWLATQDEYDEELPRIGAWTVGSVGLFAAVAALLIWSQVQSLGGEADVMGEAPYIAMNMITIGAVVGVLVGIYDARSTSRQRALQRERDRVQQFAQKAADINNYGRELNRSASIDEVSSLCIQSLQTFLGLTDIAFVTTEGDGVELIDNTIVAVPEATVEQTAIAALEQSEETVVFDEKPVEEFGEDTTVLTILVTSLDTRAAVIVASVGPDVSVGDEDEQLLEMLASHAATALERIEQGDTSEDEPTQTKA